MSTAVLTCIVCPIGCRLEVAKEKNAGFITYQVSGNTCKRGEKYAIDELTNPTRMLTTTIQIKGTHLRRLPVKTSAPIPKDKVFTCMEALNELVISAPVKCGDKVIENFLGLEIDIVSSRSLECYK